MIRTVTVVDAPDVDAGADQNVKEGHSVSVTANVTDADPGDSHTFQWTVSADNGQSISNGTGPDFNFVPHDNGTYTVSVTATDSFGETGTDTVTVNVSNVAPTWTNFTLTADVNESGTATLSGTLADLGTADTFTVTVNWGEGAAEQFNIPASGAGSQTVTLTHTYDDDDLSNAPSDDFAVTMTIIDDDGQTATGLPASTNVTVHNTDSTISSVINDGPVAPGTIVTVSIAASDLGGADDPLMYEYDFDNDNVFEVGPTSSSAGTHAFLGTGTFNVNVRVTDDDGGSTTAATSIVVAPAVSFFSSSQFVSEDAGTAVITAKFDVTAASDVIVPLLITGTAADGADVVLPEAFLTIPAGSDTGTFTFDIVDNLLNEYAETIVVTMNQQTGSSPGTIARHTVTINDNDPLPAVSFTSSGKRIDEGVGTVTISAQLSEVSGRDVIVPLLLSGTADETDDYSLPTGAAVVIPEGSLIGSTTVVIHDDTLGEKNESIIIDMQPSVQAQLSAAHNAPLVQTFIIALSDTPSVSFTSAGRLVNEADGNVTATVRLSNPSAETITVPVSISADSTANANDFTVNTTELVFAPGETEKDVVVTIIDDNVSATVMPTQISMTRQYDASNPFNGLRGGERSTPALGDLDGDGDLDLVAGNKHNGFDYFKNTGTVSSPVFTQQIGATNPLDLFTVDNFSSNGSSYYFEHSSPTLGDLDGDGDLDLIAGNGTGGFSVFENTGTAVVPNFEWQDPLNLDGRFFGHFTEIYPSASWGDIDGDADLDLLVGNVGYDVAEYRNTNQYFFL